MKVAISYTTKNRPELRCETLPRVTMNPAYDLHIVDGSDDVWRPISKGGLKYYTFHPNVLGGADAAIAFSLSMMLRHEANYTHVGLVEQDVLLDEGWFVETMDLFEKGKQDGLAVGAISARSYVDRVLVQRDDHAIMHNLGAGMVIFTREAAEIVLRTFRTHWWPDNVRLFAQVSGIDLRTYAAFRGMEGWATTDWGWEAQLARHGLASLALTPAKCQMIGQTPPLEQQGLELTHGLVEVRRDDAACKKFAASALLLRARTLWDDHCHSYELPGMIHRDGAGMLFFPHQLGALNARWQGTLELQWNQGYGPFFYRAGPGGASLSLHISGSASFQCSGGVAGARVTIEDHRSGFKASPALPPNTAAAIAVPGSVVPRRITMQMDEGAVFQALSCADPQMIDTTWKFDWNQLPAVPGEVQRSGEAK
jgi:hypothetical protein